MKKKEKKTLVEKGVVASHHSCRHFRLSTDYLNEQIQYALLTYSNSIEFGGVETRIQNREKARKNEEWKRGE